MYFGNYFGVVKNWVVLQEKYDCIYGVVDYYVMMMFYNLKKFWENIWELFFNLMVVGVKLEFLFIQFLVLEYIELCWIFNCFIFYGQLICMMQFKDKSVQVVEIVIDSFIFVGLLDYFVLQVVDILIYWVDYVFVGKDQEQYLEFICNIV